jgi:hypothetical protein
VILSPVIIVVIVLLVFLFKYGLSKAYALPHGVLRTLMDQAWAVEHLVKLHVVIVLGMRLLDGADEAIRLAMLQLPRFGALKSVTVVMIIGTVVAVIVMLVTVIVALVIVVVRWAIGLGSTTNFFVALFSLLSSVLVVRLEHLADQERWLPVP